LPLFISPRIHFLIIENLHRTCEGSWFDSEGTLLSVIPPYHYYWHCCARLAAISHTWACFATRTHGLASGYMYWILLHLQEGQRFVQFFINNYKCHSLVFSSCSVTLFTFATS
jgi:hypothetical protein